MEENNLGKIVYKKEIETNYYTKRSQKIVDFGHGFFLSILLIITFFILIPFFISSFFQGGGFLRSMATSMVIFISPIIILIIISIYYSKKKRRYVTMGIIFSPLICILVFGSCLYMTLGIRGPYRPTPIGPRF